MKKVYLMLTKSSTPISLVINLFTRDRYTHSSCSLQPDLKPIYSIGRRFTFLPWPAGFKTEPLDRGFWFYHRHARVGVYSLELSDQGYEKMKEYIARQEVLKPTFSYIGIINCAFHKARHYQNKMFCSQFVAEALKASGEVEISKDTSLFHPIDIMNLANTKEVFSGRIWQLNEFINQQNGRFE